MTSEADGEGPVPIGSVALVVEISDSTLQFDLGKKCRTYAAAGIPDYWVVDIEGKRILMHTNPRDGRYPAPEEIEFGRVLKAKTIDGLVVEANALG